ncbi:MAG: WG repeat-containing protein [Symploca sp. SIO2E6]|nr:WG repeat-containing protein [Symploca sp. SIO2E6]
MKYAFHPEALTEYSQAVEFYAEHNKELAQEFINSVESAIFKVLVISLICFDPPKSPLIRGTLNPVPPFLRGVRGDRLATIDTAGQLVSRMFDNFNSFYQGLAAVEIGSKWGYINKTGQVVIQPQFDDVDNFSQWLAAVEIDSKWGYIDTTGQVVIQPQFDNAGRFYNGEARIEIKKKLLGIVPNFMERHTIDKTGKFID